LITGLDDLVGRLINKLKEKKLQDNTVILSIGDHGYYYGEKMLSGGQGKSFRHDNSVRTFCYIYDPRLPGNTRGRRNELTANIDVAPTICSLAGVSVPDQYQGTSMYELITKDIPWRKEILCERSSIESCQVNARTIFNLAEKTKRLNKGHL